MHKFYLEVLYETDLEELIIHLHFVLIYIFDLFVKIKNIKKLIFCLFYLAQKIYEVNHKKIFRN